MRLKHSGLQAQRRKTGRWTPRLCSSGDVAPLPYLSHYCLVQVREGWDELKVANELWAGSYSDLSMTKSLSSLPLVFLSTVVKSARLNEQHSSERGRSEWPEFDCFDANPSRTERRVTRSVRCLLHRNRNASVELCTSFIPIIVHSIGSSCSCCGGG